MARILVVDDDPWIQRMVSSVLNHAGHEVALAADGWEGLVTADQVKPDLLVVKTALPTADGWKMVDKLRALDDLAQTPALFLASFVDQDRRGPSYRAGFDDVLVKPFRLEDLLAKVQTLLAAHVKATGDVTAVETHPAPLLTPPPRSMTPPDPDPMVTPRPTPGRSALNGTLEQFSAASVLMLLDLERRSGVLILSSTTGRGRVYLREGRIVRASVEGRTELRGAVAVYPMLLWSKGRFEFHPGDVAGEDEIGSSTSYLLMEGARRQDEDAAAKDGDESRN